MKVEIFRRTVKDRRRGASWDLLQHMAEGVRACGDEPVIVNENMTANKALSIMNEKKITSLLVKSDKDIKKNSSIKLKGIVHIHELLRYGIK